MRIPLLTESIEIPQKTEAKLDGRVLTIKGPKGELSREVIFQKILLAIDGKKISLSSKNATKREKTHLGTLKAHIKNMIKGVLEGHVYKLKICSGHFPMNVSATSDTLTVKNFLGEKVPRVLKLKKGVKVSVEGAEVTVEGTDIEKAGQVAADIEQLTRITNRDIRIFQDGIYITKKSKRQLN
jgi:large subunit ribosomal protein L6